MSEWVSEWDGRMNVIQFGDTCHTLTIHSTGISASIHHNTYIHLSSSTKPLIHDVLSKINLWFALVMWKHLCDRWQHNKQPFSSTLNSYPKKSLERGRERRHQDPNNTLLSTFIVQFRMLSHSMVYENAHTSSDTRRFSAWWRNQVLFLWCAFGKRVNWVIVDWDEFHLIVSLLKHSSRFQFQWYTRMFSFLLTIIESHWWCFEFNSFFYKSFCVINMAFYTAINLLIQITNLSSSVKIFHWKVDVTVIAVHVTTVLLVLSRWKIYRLIAKKSQPNWLSQCW